MQINVINIDYVMFSKGYRVFNYPASGIVVYLTEYRLFLLEGNAGAGAMRALHV